jgi:threonylcarbamoyladenosine tRNA methylthiotransferase MtaB
LAKIAFYTLGCRANQYETDVMMRDAAKLGFKVVPYRSKADIYVINSCTVTNLADRKSRHMIRHAKKINPAAKVIATGCFTEKGNVPTEADIIIPTDKKHTLTEHLKKICSALTDKGTRPKRQIRANLMIETGCENFCSYCIVPLVRGPIKCRPKTEIINEAKEMVAEGVKEIVLTGINIGEYPHLTHLISDLCKLDGLLRLRISSIEPMYVTDELISLFNKGSKLCRHLHIPLQSGDDGILKAMRRTYTTGQFLKLIKKVQKKVKDIAITTDIIVGFPGEDEKAFKNTMKTAKKAGFSKIHIFSYSDRPGTKASKMPNKIDPKIIAKRHEELSLLQDKMTSSFNRSFMKKTVDVLVENINKRSGMLYGHTSNFIRVEIENDRTELIGTIVKVKKLRDGTEHMTANLARSLGSPD